MMKKIAVLLLFLSVIYEGLAQKDYSSNLTAIPITELPFDGVKNDPPIRTFHLSYRSFPLMNSNMWKDLQLAVPLLDSPNGWWISTLERRFTPIIGNYYLGLIYFGVADTNKKMLFTLDSNHNYIDALEVNAKLLTNKPIRIKHFKIDVDMRVTVLQLKPTSPTSIMMYTDVKFPLRAQRIDTVYQIDSNGKFSQISQTIYQPKDYSEKAFINIDRDIWNGNEIPMK